MVGVLVGVAIALAATAVADAREGCESITCKQRVSARLCSNRAPAHCLSYAARRYRVSYPLLRRIAWCESGLNPRARNPSGATGLMQFIASTWAITPWARHERVWARWNALAGAWLLKRDGPRHWYASRHCWA